MGMIRADGDIIRAINAMTDLNDMVRKYINIHRRVLTVSQILDQT